MNLDTLSRVVREAHTCMAPGGDPEIEITQSDCADLVIEVDLLLRRYQLLYCLVAETSPGLLDSLERVTGTLRVDSL